MPRNQELVDLSTLARDNEGFLLQPQDWSVPIANAIALESGQELGERHWEVIHFIRDYFEQTEMVPEARKLLQFMRSKWGDAEGTRRSLYRLFPTGYGQTACKIAGMRKPLKLMLDV
jgi:tRNA 2-thiouridine synthesizing protein E